MPIVFSLRALRGGALTAACALRLHTTVLRSPLCSQAVAEAVAVAASQSLWHLPNILKISYNIIINHMIAFN